MGGPKQQTKGNTTNEFTLDPYDRVILEELCTGSSIAAIAVKLGRSIATVNRRRARLCERAQVFLYQLPLWGLQQTNAFVLGGKCRPVLHPARCPCESPYCTSVRRREAA